MTRLFLMTRRISLKFWSRCLIGSIIVFFTAGFSQCPPIPSLRATGNQDTAIPEVCGSFDRRFYSPGLSDDSFYHSPSIAAMVVDAKGNMFVGGRFTSIDNVVAYHIARYDIATDTWSALANNGLKEFGGPSITVEALAISGDDLFVAGRFSQTADGSVTNLTNIARYNLMTNVWSPLAGNGLHYSLNNGNVYALAISGNDLFVGGQFRTTADNATTNLNNIARYNIAANTWSPLTGNGLGQGFSGTVSALAISENELYVGGNFTQNHNGSTTNLNNIARYNISANSWSPLTGNGLTNGFGYGYVYALTISGGNLFVGGEFSQTANGSTMNLNGIARFIIGNGWMALEGGGLKNGAFTGSVSALAISGSDLFVGGNFTQTFNETTTNLNGIARYNLTGSGSWSSLTGNGLGVQQFGSLNRGSADALTIVGGDLFVGGIFSQTFDGSTKNLNRVARYGISTNSWSVSGSKNGIALDGDVNALAVHTNGSIYVGGNFTKTLNGVTTNLNGIARYNTAANTWSALGNNGLNGTVTALTFSGDDLFVGGDFSMTADGVTTLNRIARYNITNGTWSALTGGAMDGNGLNNSVHALAISGNNLFVGGNFTQTIGGTPTNLNRIARYNIAANTWSALTGGVMDGNGLNNSVQALTISGNNLFVGGNFTQTVGGATTTLNRIARYNTSTNVWSALANNGLNDFVRALVVSGNDLFVGGYFTETFDGTKSLNRLARYNTADNVWTAITGDADVYAAATAVSAGKTSGTDLIAGGFFTGVNCGVTHTFTRFYLQQWIVAPDSPDKLTATDWHDGANWTAGTAPAANTNAVIPASAGNVEITSADVTMNDLMLNGGTLTVGANRTLTINGILSLSGGKIYGAGTVVIANCQSDGIMNGSATGYIQTALVRCVNNAETFNFPVGTANDYSPVTVKNITGTGNISIRANQGAYSNPAIGLPANRLARWWQIENPGGGITNANLIFNYLQSDIAGNENNYKAYRITSGAASVIASSVNSSSNRLTAQNIAGFSDWTLGESAPTAASVAVSGRVSAFKGRAGISNARISITDANGATRYAITNSFGYYRFADVPAGETYIISVSHKRYRFADNPQVLTVTEEFGELNFTAQPSFQKELL